MAEAVRYLLRHLSCFAPYSPHNHLLTLCTVQFTKGQNPMFVERVVIERSRTTGWWYASTLLVAIIVAIAVGFGVAYGLYENKDEKVVVQTVPFWPAFEEDGPAAHWSYDLEGEDRPENWGMMRDDNGVFYNPLCKSTDASQQSPIALPLPDMDNAILQALNKSYPALSYQVVARPSVSTRSQRYQRRCIPWYNRL
jgi:hypothetical protein